MSDGVAGEEVAEEVKTQQGIHIDPVTLVAVQNGVEIDLTLLELRILAYFISKRGEIVSRLELLQKIWKTSFCSNMADVYVAYLRKKIGSDAIVTIRGSGYKLVA